MSYDMLVFEKLAAPMFFEDFLVWIAAQTDWSEERDYDFIDGTSPKLAAWFMEMKERFPPLNGPYSPADDEAFAEAENRLGDYTIGSGVIHASFSGDAGVEAEKIAPELARKHGVGFFDPQTSAVVCDEMVIGRMRTESRDDHNAAWEMVERSILSLDDPARGTSNRDGAGMTLWFTPDRIDGEFLQCSPLYPKSAGILGRLFGAKADTGIASYTVEAGTGEKIYAVQVADKDEVRRIFREYYFSRKLPDVSGWEDTGIL